MKFPKNMEWTQQAIDCYNIGCWCEKCILNETMNNKAHKCMMKATVIELVRRFGKPKPIRNKEDKLDLEEIKQYMRDGYIMTEIAKIYGIGLNKFRDFTQSHGLTRREIYALKEKKGKWRV